MYSVCICTLVLDLQKSYLPRKHTSASRDAEGVSSKPHDSTRTVVAFRRQPDDSSRNNETVDRIRACLDFRQLLAPPSIENHTPKHVLFLHISYLRCAVDFFMLLVALLALPRSAENSSGYGCSRSDEAGASARHAAALHNGTAGKYFRL